MVGWADAFLQGLTKYHVFHIVSSIFLVLAFVCAWRTVTVKSEPRDGLVASPSQRHLGFVRQGKTVAAEFPLHNISSHSIDIVEIKHTCACTSHSLKQMTVAPGEIATLTMNINTAYRRDKVTASSFIEYCERDGEKKPRHLFVQMTADIDPDYDVVPREIVFRKGDPPMRDVHLVLRHVQSLSITKVECDRRCFVAKKCGPNDGLEKCVCVTYNAKDDHSDEPMGELTIHTDCANQPTLCVPLRREK